MSLSVRSGRSRSVTKCRWLVEALIPKILIALVMLSGAHVGAAENQLSILIKNIDSVELDLSSHVELFWDRSGETSLQKIAAQPDRYFKSPEEASSAPRLGVNTYWVRLRLREGAQVSQQVRDWVLVVESPELKESALYVRESSGYSPLWEGKSPANTASMS